ncbi:hypothetical protein FS842_004303, partial [Serendipita sp. 407]
LRFCKPCLRHWSFLPLFWGVGNRDIQYLYIFFAINAPFSLAAQATLFSSDLVLPIELDIIRDAVQTSSKGVALPSALKNRSDLFLTSSTAVKARVHILSTISYPQTSSP